MHLVHMILFIRYWHGFYGANMCTDKSNYYYKESIESVVVRPE